MDNEALYNKGLATRHKVLGEERESQRAAEDDFSIRFREFTTKYVWGEIWASDGLPLKTRSLVNIALMTSIKAQSELKTHFRAALKNGCTKQEISEVLMMCATSCGVPTMREALKTAQGVFAEMEKK